MATPKKPTTTRRAPRKTASATTTPRKTAVKRSVATRAGKAISDRPVAAIATGLVSGIAAAVAGFFAFKKSGKSLSEFSGDVASSVKDSATETSARVKDGLSDAGTKAKNRVSKLRDGVDKEKTQSEIAEEALTLKETGKKNNDSIDPVVDEQSKVGAISY